MMIKAYNAQGQWYASKVLRTKGQKFPFQIWGLTLFPAARKGRLRGASASRLLVQDLSQAHRYVFGNNRRI